MSLYQELKSTDELKLHDRMMADKKPEDIKKYFLLGLMHKLESRKIPPKKINKLLQDFGDKLTFEVK